MFVAGVALGEAMIPMSVAVIAPLVLGAAPQGEPRAPELAPAAEVRLAQASVRSGVRDSRRHWEREVSGKHGGPKGPRTEIDPAPAQSSGAQHSLKAPPKAKWSSVKKEEPEPPGFWAWLFGW